MKIIKTKNDIIAVHQIVGVHKGRNYVTVMLPTNGEAEVDILSIEDYKKFDDDALPEKVFQVVAEFLEDDSLISLDIPILLEEMKENEE